MIICVDFDGTCVTHEFPEVGKDIGAVPVLKQLVEHGHKLVLFTMRSDVKNPTSKDDTIICKPGNYLTDAVNWFKENGIDLYGIQTNPEQKNWTSSPKAYGQMYIDDAALGCPLITPGFGRPFVDWYEVNRYLYKNGILED
jgi:hypothetical protein